MTSSVLGTYFYESTRDVVLDVQRGSIIEDYRRLADERQGTRGCHETEEGARKELKLIKNNILGSSTSQFCLLKYCTILSFVVKVAETRLTFYIIC